ncbi:hypothetical protein ACW0PQ_003298, partial [Escherichia coli]
LHQIKNIQKQSCYVKSGKNVRNVIEVVFFGGEMENKHPYGKKDASCGVTIRDTTQVPVLVL